MPEKPTPPSTEAIRVSMVKAIADLQKEIDAAAGGIATSEQNRKQRETDLRDAIAKAKTDEDKAKLTAEYQKWLGEWEIKYAVASSALEGLREKKKDTQEALAEFDAQTANLGD